MLHLLGGPVLWEMFDLGAEANVPTWWASMLWMSVAMACVGCYRKDAARERSALASRLWLVLAAVFALASMDEVATIHEEVGTFLHRQFLSRGWFLVVPEGAPDSPWIVFYAPFLVAFAAWAVWFSWRKLRAQRRLVRLVVAGFGCYAVAVSFDYYQGLPYQQEEAIARFTPWNASALVDASVAAEETLENLGSTCLLAAFASYAARGAPDPEG
jgi:hypothetical protein